MSLQRLVKYHPRFVGANLCQTLSTEAGPLFPLERSQCKIFGKICNVPRDQFVVLFDDRMKPYRYSGQEVPVVHTFPSLEEIRALVEGITGCRYNFALVNRYRDGKDGVGWHADDESSIDQAYPIASVSVGGTRQFDLRLKEDKKQKLSFSLHNGDLVVMEPGCQEKAHHQVPKRAHAQSRINITFRVMK